MTIFTLLKIYFCLILVNAALLKSKVIRVVFNRNARKRKRTAVARSNPCLHPEAPLFSKLCKFWLEIVASALYLKESDKRINRIMTYNKSLKYKRVIYVVFCCFWWKNALICSKSSKFRKAFDLLAASVQYCTLTRENKKYSSTFEIIWQLD